eukprot:8713833-Ditylum_brightwellii.AAC.1
MVSILASGVNVLSITNMGLAHMGHGPWMTMAMTIQCHCYWKRMIATLSLFCELEILKSQLLFQ